MRGLAEHAWRPHEGARLQTVLIAVALSYFVVASFGHAWPDPGVLAGLALATALAARAQLNRPPVRVTLTPPFVVLVLVVHGPGTAAVLLVAGCVIACYVPVRRGLAVLWANLAIELTSLLAAATTAELLQAAFSVSGALMTAATVGVAYVVFLAVNAFLVSWLPPRPSSGPVRASLLALVRVILVAEMGVALVTMYATHTYIAIGPAAGIVSLVVFMGIARHLLDKLLTAQRLAEERRRLVRSTLAAHERERRQLAERLHDGPLQDLMLAAQEVSEVTSGDDAATAALQRVIGQLRTVVADLHPVMPGAVELRGAILTTIDTIAGAGPARIVVERCPAGLDPTDGLIVSTARELLVNVLRHADADHAWISIEARQDKILLEVRDDGRGLLESEVDEAILRGHIGIAGCRERVGAAGGTFVIGPRAGGGTVVQVSLPLTAAVSEPAMSS